MSPVGLDVREFGYSYFDYTAPDAATHEINPVVTNPGFPASWNVMRIQAWAAAGAAFTLQLNGQAFPIAAGGCVELLPGGAFRGTVVVSGTGGRVLIEYWYSATANAALPGISVT